MAESTSRWWRDALVLLVAAAVGAGIFWFVSRDAAPGPAVTLDLPAASAAPDAGPPVRAGDGADVPDVDPADVTDSRTAVEAFLRAEVDRDFAASFALLDDETRARVVTVAGWTNAHADVGRITGFVVTEVDGDDVVVDLALDAKLDPVIGLVPGTATSTWTTVDTPDGVRVAYDDSVVVPVYPDDAAASAVALDWAAAVQSGDDARDLQAVRSLAGRIGYVDLVADSTGDFDAGEPFVLPPDGGDSNLLSRFGAEVVSWGRAVSLTGPVDVTVVLAPIGEEWQVVGLIDP